jgi:hypothetical protein
MTINSLSIRSISFALICLVAAPSLGHAASFSESSDAADGTIRSHVNATPPDPTIENTTDFQGRVGEFFAPDAITLMLPFLLPTLPTGETIDTAHLRLQLFDRGNTGTLGNADLYGLGVRSAATVLTTDYYTGSTPDLTDATLIQSSFLTPASPLRTDPNTGPFINTSTNGDISLVSYLNTAYAGGTNAGKFVFLRVSYAVDQPTPNGNNFYSLLTDDAGGSNEKPLLTFTTSLVSVPEPSTWVFLISGTGLLMAYRRRNRRA